MVRRWDGLHRETADAPSLPSFSLDFDQPDLVVTMSLSMAGELDGLVFNSPNPTHPLVMTRSAHQCVMEHRLQNYLRNFSSQSGTTEILVTSAIVYVQL